MSGPTAVLDASAVAALLLAEPGGRRVADALAEGAALSTVNLSEVATLLVRRHRDPAQLVDRLNVQIDVHPFDGTDAVIGAALSPVTRPAGLSLGDRACLALAQRLGLPVTVECLRGA